MPIAEKMIKMLEGSMTIRRMFEEGARLKAEHGPENVFDFSLGNPDVPPPPEFVRVLRDMVSDDDLYHGYSPNAGYPQVRQALADYLGGLHGVALNSDLIIMTVGAAGALNNIFRALMSPGEEILTPRPFFVGYTQYAFVAGAALKTAPTTARFGLDLAAIEAAITEKTRVMLINSPNNPTGAVYSAAELAGLSEILERASNRFGRRIYLISDEPYRKIAYDVEVPSIFQAYRHSIIVSSYSKELSLAGERIGYLVIHPQAEDAGLVAGVAAVANTMYYVNAPSMMQLAVAKLQGITVDVSVYRRRRDMICEILARAGYEFSVPEGAFYMFPKSPIPDDIKFIDLLKSELILAVPGTGFGAPGYFRLSYAVPDATISGSAAGFKRALETALS
jgi:aspartate aminotransferase